MRRLSGCLHTSRFISKYAKLRLATVDSNVFGYIKIENAVVRPTRPERNHLIVPIHASMMLHPYMFTLPSGIYMPYCHLLENTSLHAVEENMLSRKWANPLTFYRVKVKIYDATHRMAFLRIKKNDGCHFCVETSFLLHAVRFLLRRWFCTQYWIERDGLIQRWEFTHNRGGRTFI